MQVRLFADNSLPLPVESVCDVVNPLCQEVRLAAGSANFRIATSVLSAPSAFERLSPKIRDETENVDLAVLATSVPYEDNFFFYTYGNRVILSFAGWNTLTDLPVSNGLVYFISALLIQKVQVGTRHETNTGCINDFWWNKRGVDLGMRAAFICGKLPRGHTSR